MTSHYPNTTRPWLHLFIMLSLFVFALQFSACGNSSSEDGGESTGKSGSAKGKKSNDKHVANEKYKVTDTYSKEKKTASILNRYQTYLLKGGANVNPPENLEAAMKMYNEAAKPMVWKKKDLWGNPYQYKAVPGKDYDFTVFSSGPDGVVGNADDVFPNSTRGD